MSRLSLKTDFKDGDILYGAQLNTNNEATVEAVNDNYERIMNLQDLKADIVDVNDKLGTKVDTSVFNSTIDSINTTKADKSEVALKADKTELATKADKSELQQGLSLKADVTYVNNQLSTKANKSDVDSSLALKADKANTYTKDETTAAINSAVSTKADKSELNNKANKSDLGNLSDLITTNKSSAVAAINEIKREGSEVSNIDNLSINKNNSGAIQAVGVIDRNSEDIAIKTWTGTKEEYDALETKDANTLYYITDDEDSYELVSNKVTSISSSSTDEQYPSAKAVYDIIQGITPGEAANTITVIKNNSEDNPFVFSQHDTGYYMLGPGLSTFYFKATTQQTPILSLVGSYSIHGMNHLIEYSYKIDDDYTLEAGGEQRIGCIYDYALDSDYSPSAYKSYIDVFENEENLDTDIVSSEYFRLATLNDIPTATTEKAGKVKPDGVTVTVDADGTIHSVGGSGGTSDYSDLENKPQINGVTLEGNKTSSDLGITSGATYTAGTNMEITEDNVINNTIPYNPDGTGINSLAIGKNSYAISSESVSIGIEARSSDSNSISIGRYATSGQYGIAIGSRCDPSNSTATVAIGYYIDNRIATKMGSIIIGANNVSDNYNIHNGSIVIGTNATYFEDNAAIFGSTSCPVNNMYYISSEGRKTVATTDQTVPAGGTTGQVLMKNSDADYDFGWSSLNDYDEVSF